MDLRTRGFSVGGGRGEDLNALPVEKALMSVRVIWGGLILGQVAFMAVEAVILSQPPPVGGNPVPANLQILFVVNLVMLVTVVPVMYLVRRMIHGKGRGEDGAIRAGSYVTGNIIFWAGCEAVSFFGLVVALIGRSFSPTIFVVVVAILLQVLTFPRLGDVKARGERFGD